MFKILNSIGENVMLALHAIVSITEHPAAPGGVKLDPETQKAVTIHLNNGSNVCAIVDKAADIAAEIDALLCPKHETHKVSPAGVTEVFEAMKHAPDETTAYGILNEALNR